MLKDIFKILNKNIHRVNELDKFANSNVSADEVSDKAMGIYYEMSVDKKAVEEALNGFVYGSEEFTKCKECISKLEKALTYVDGYVDAEIREACKNLL